MKHIIISILLIIYGFAIISPALPMVDYVMHYKHISQDLCENKDKPEMHCNGKCHLKKEIKKVLDNNTNNKKKTVLPTLKLKEYTNYYTLQLVHKYLKSIDFTTNHSLFLLKKPSTGFVFTLIKPPPFKSIS